jgi:hypothetical protein
LHSIQMISEFGVLLFVFLEFLTPRFPQFMTFWYESEWVWKRKKWIEIKGEWPRLPKIFLKCCGTSSGM